VLIASPFLVTSLLPAAAAPIAGGLATSLHRLPADTVVNEIILPPDPVIVAIQWIFQRPPWVMWGGVVLGAIVAVVLLRWLWPYRRKVWGAASTRLGQLVFYGGLLIALVTAVGVGAKSMDFVENDKRFCTGCHIFVPSGQHWVAPDTGFYTLVNKLEGKHDTLGCHACHELNMAKEAVKMVFWMSGDRGTGQHVPPHAKVPRHVCEGCHVQGAAQKTWQAIATTAGHRTHLESDSLKSHIECLTCHARAAHRFVPPDTTCSQHGCHLTSQVQIRLGKMADQVPSHCNACHRFTKAVPLLATRDSAAGSLRPGEKQCLECHGMLLRTANFDLAKDPHSKTCGFCHNPHIQVKPADALKSCATAGCHDNWRTVAFHAGKAHGRIAPRCEVCHDPHAARVDASDCTGCHARAGVRGGGTNVVPPQPFDTTQALKRTSALPPPRVIHGKGDAPPDEDFPAAQLSVPPAADTFPHKRHESLQCITCHSLNSRSSTLTFVPPRGCQICHHQAPQRNECAKCHEEGGDFTFQQVRLTVTVPRHQPQPRLAIFSHTVHAKAVKCTDCHTTPVLMTPADSVIRCEGCHEKHHAASRNCSVCHSGPWLATAHADARQTHIGGCDACHTPAVVALLTPTRSLCLTCHGDKTDHNDTRECTSCHLLETPEGWRDHLMRPAAAP
jgi:hypothetical protein